MIFNYDGNDIKEYSASVNRDLPLKKTFCSVCHIDLSGVRYFCFDYLHALDIAEHTHLCERCVSVEIVEAADIAKMVGLLIK